MNNASEAHLNFRIVTVLLSCAGRKTTLASHEVARIFQRGRLGGRRTLCHNKVCLTGTVSQVLPDCDCVSPVAQFVFLFLSRAMFRETVTKMDVKTVNVIEKTN